MAAPPNVELEAAKFLQKLIQESKDEPTKLATKLYAILHHMRSSGKEDSMPYQVISRAMETVISQHGLDINALASSRPHLATGTQVLESSSSQFGANSSLGDTVKEANTGLTSIESVKADCNASNRPPVVPSSGGHDINQGSISYLNKKYLNHGSPSSFDTRSAKSQSEERCDSPKWEKAKQKDSNKGGSKRKRVDLSSNSVSQLGNSQPPESSTFTSGMDEASTKYNQSRGISIHDGEHGQFNCMFQSSSMLGHDSMRAAHRVKQEIQHQAEKSLDSLHISNSLSRTPHSRHPEEIEVSSSHNASIFRQEISHPLSHDALDTRDIKYQNKTGSLIEKSRVPGFSFHASGGNSSAETLMHKSAGTADYVYGMEIGTSGPNATAVPAHLVSVQFSNTYDNPILGPKVLKERNIKSSSSASPLELPSGKGAFGKALDYEGGSLHTIGHENIAVQGSMLTTESIRKLPVSQSSSASILPFKEHHLKQLRAQCLVYLAFRNGLEPKKLHLDFALGNFLPKEDDPEISRTSFRSSDGSRMVPVDSALLNDNLLTAGVTDDASAASDSPLPKYTTTEKWILDQQKRKLLTQRIWSLKLQRTQQRITAFSAKSKDSVSSSKDIFAKTRSIIESKKLQLLELQSRFRNDILNDFFKPIASDMDRLKSIKKHRIGRKPKQLEKYEQKMKEERQKRFLERQKEFFSEIAIHKERLEDVFKLRRERWKGFNRSVKEFHKRKERVHREKIDRIQREKINLLKINDVEGYLRMVKDAKSDRVKQLLKETEKYLQKLGSKLRDAKVMNRCFDKDIDDTHSAGVMETNEVPIDNEDETDQAKHYLESNENYYLMAHSIKENVAEQPSCLVGGKLREYQMNGLRWLVSLYNNHLNGILADEMGLGKTVQVISLICYLMENKNDRGPFLVVVPSSVLPGWDSEINFWAPSINKIVYSGPPEERRRLFKERIVPQKFNVLLTTYEYLMNKHDRPKLSKIHWHYVIIDEGHRIKNASCKLNADLKLYHSSHRLLLTGTPLQNNLEELWALLNFLLPNIFNSSEDFSQWFNKPFESSGDSSPDEALLSEEENLLIINRLHQVLRPFVLRRLKHKVENELPEKIERLVRCEASGYQKLLMKRVEDNLGALGTSKARSVHNSVMELRNICNHPYLSQLHSEEVHDYIPKHYLPNIVRLCGKLEMLDRILPKLKATGHRVLLFSTMTRLLDVMEDYLYWKQYKYLRLDGHTSGGDRGALIDKYNKADSPYFIFLLSIRAGGVGVNLQAADTVIIFDTDWNPQVDLQAQARAHRIGQKREVLVLRFETVQTVEEQVRAAAEHKLGVANQSITAGFFDNNTSAEDRREYLESLLRESKKEEAAPALHDDAVNNLIARSESEIDIFEAVDKRREEEEMVAWKSALGEGRKSSEPVLTLPSRLLTAEELKVFCEAMKIYDAQTPAVVSDVGMKRKSGYVGGLDTQHYGRGKRAREVRSYEEQWTEDEFEQMCQVETPHSLKMTDEVKEMNLPMVSNNNFNIDVKAETVILSEQPTQTQLLPSVKPPPVQSVQPLPVKTTQQPLVFSEQSMSPHRTQSANPDVQAAQSPDMQEAYPVVQDALLKVTRQSKEITPKRGRGRPKRVTTHISPSKVIFPALSRAANMNAGSQIGTANSFGDTSLNSVPISTVVEDNTGRSHQFSVLASPSSQAIASLPCAFPSSQPNPVSSAVPIANKRRGRKNQSGGETPQGRGNKRSAVSSSTSPSPGTDSSSMVSQGETVSAGPSTSVHATVSVVPHASHVDKEASSQIFVPSLLPSSGTSKQQDAVASSFPVLCSPSVTTEISVRGIELHSGITDSQQILSCHSLPTDSLLASGGNDNSSEQNLPLSSVSYVPLAQAVPNQVKRHGRKAQDESEAPQRRGRNASAEAPLRRGRKASASSTAVLSGSGSQELKSTEPPQKKSIVSSGRATVTTRSKQENETDLDVSVSDGILLTKVEACESTLDPAAIAGLVGDKCIVTKDDRVRHLNSPNERPGEKKDLSVESVIVPKDNRQEYLAERSQTQTDEAKPIENMGIVEESIQHERIEEQGGQILHDTYITLAKTEHKSEKNNVEQCRTQTGATGDKKILVLDAAELDRHEHKEGGAYHVDGEVLAEVGQIDKVLDEQFQIREPVNLCEKIPGYQGAIGHDEREHEYKLPLAGADSAAEFKQTSESLIARSCKSQEIKDIDPLKELPIEKCKYQTNEVSELQKKAEVLHTDLQLTIGLEFEEPPSELHQAQSKKDPKHSEKVEAQNVGEISTEAVQGLEKLPKGQLQTRGKEDSESCKESIEIPRETSCANMEQGDIGNHSNVEVTFEVEQILEEPSDQQCRTQEFEASEKVEFLNEQHQTQMEEVLEPSEIGKEMSGETTCDGVEQGDQVLLDNVEVDWSLEEPSVQQCQTRLEKDVKASRIIVLSSEHHQTRAEESTERTEQGDKILCDDVEVPVKVCHSLEEPSVKQCQTPIERVFEPSRNLEDFEEAAKHEAIEKQGGEASLSVEETEAESCQTLEELPGKQSRSEVEDIQTEETNAGRSNDVKEVTQNVEMDSRTNLIVDSGEENEPKLRI